MFAIGSATEWLALMTQTLIPLVIIGLLVALIVGSSRKRAEDRALDAARMGARVDRAPQAPSTTAGDRLAEIERLFAAGVISAAEREEARRRVVGEL